MSSRPLEIARHEMSSALILKVTDRALPSLDAEQLHDLRSACAQAAAAHPDLPRVVLDLSQVCYYGAAFLGMLVSLSQELSEQGQELMVCGDRPRLLQVACLNRMIPEFRASNYRVAAAPLSLCS